MKFIKTELNGVSCYISACGEYKAIDYSGVRLYHKDTFINHKTRKKYRAFGNAVEYQPHNNSSKIYSNYKEAFKQAEIHKLRGTSCNSKQQ